YTAQGVPPDVAWNQGGVHFPPSLSGFFGLLISPGRGLFLFSPIIFFCLVGLWRTFHQPIREEQRKAFVLALAALASFTMFAGFGEWGGAWCYGPRYLMEAGTLLFYFLPAAAALIESSIVWRRVWLTAAVWSVIMHAIGAYAAWDW